MDKTGKYCYVAEPFHCDFSHRLFMSQLGNHLLNASEFHANERGFGMEVVEICPPQDVTQNDVTKNSDDQEEKTNGNGL